MQLSILGTALLALLAALSSWPDPARAHEVQPSVADVTLAPARLQMEIAATLEPFIAGIDLDGLLNTNSSAQAAEVDRLRALPPDTLAQAFRDFWPELQQKLTIRAGDAAVPLTLDGVDVPEAGDVALPRLSRLRLSAALPDDGTPVTIGWTGDLGALVLRQMDAGADAYTAFLQGGQRSAPIPREGAVAQSAAGAFATYVVSGFDHIIPRGLDHILFVLGLYFLSLNFRTLLWQVTAFTVAHTCTLALAGTGLVSVPAGIVEPLIALSIVYVGVENVLSRGISPFRPVVVFLFGLLHGLGFASVLRDFGLGYDHFWPKLIGFNVGVELGQLAVIAAAFALTGLWAGRKTWYRARIANPASIAIALVGAYWVVQRTML